MSKIIGVTVGTPLNPEKFGGASQEQIAQAVVDYLTENPVEGGMTKTEKDLILSLFRNAVYTSGNMGNTLTQLESLWNGSEAPDEPDEPVVTLTRISATYSGGDVAVGTAVSALTGIVVTAHYSDGSSKTVTGYTLSGTITEGSNTITVSYSGKTTTFTVTGVAEEPEEPDVPVEPEKTLTSISATYSGGSVPVGTAVNSLTGVVVTAHYSNGTSATVVGYTLSGTIAEGNNTITVTYEGKSATFVVVGTKVLTHISATYSGGDVAVGTAVTDLTGIVVTAHYSDGSSKAVTGYTLSGTIAEGSNTITVSYGGKTTTFTVTGEPENTYTDEVILSQGNNVLKKIYSDEGATLLTQQSGTVRNKYGDPVKADIKVKIAVSNGIELKNAYVGSWDGVSDEIVNAVPISTSDGNGATEVTIKSGYRPYFCVNTGSSNHVVTMYYNASENVGPDPWDRYEHQLDLSEKNHDTKMSIYSDDGQTLLKTQSASIRNRYSNTVFEVDTPCMIVEDATTTLTSFAGSWSGEGTSVINAVPTILYNNAEKIYYAEVTIKAGCKPYYCLESGSSAHTVTMYY